MPCNKCGSILAFGKGELSVLWCPKCEGYEVLSEDKSLKYCREGIQNIWNEIQNIIDIYDTDSLLAALFVTREGELLSTQRGFGFNPSKYLSMTELISKVLKECTKGEKICNIQDTEFQTLITLADGVYDKLRTIILIRNGFAFTISVPSDKILEVGYDYETGMKVKGIQELPSKKENANIFKFNEKWKDVKVNLEEYGFVSSTEMYRYRKEKEYQETSLGDFFRAHKLRTCLELSIQNPQMLKHDEFRNKLEYLILLDKLSARFWALFEGTDHKHGLWFECSLIPVHFSEFEQAVAEIGFDSEEATNLLVCSKGDQKSFPLILRMGDSVLIPPITLLIFKELIISLYSVEYREKMSKEGFNFEEKVAMELEKVGIKIYQPNDCTKKLVNIKDDPKNPTLEIDIAGYDYSTKKMFVIDCKNIFMSTEFIIGRREAKVRRRLRGLPKKQEKRIKFMEENLQKFGFSSKKIKSYVSIVITSTKEPIEAIENTHLIPFRNLKIIKKLEPL